MKNMFSKNLDNSKIAVDASAADSLTALSGILVDNTGIWTTTTIEPVRVDGTANSAATYGYFTQAVAYSPENIEKDDVLNIRVKKRNIKFNFNL